MDRESVRVRASVRTVCMCTRKVHRQSHVSDENTDKTTSTPYATPFWMYNTFSSVSWGFTQQNSVETLHRESTLHIEDNIPSTRVSNTTVHFPERTHIHTRTIRIPSVPVQLVANLGKANDGGSTIQQFHLDLPQQTIL
jgi:hypothetical protein